MNEKYNKNIFYEMDSQVVESTKSAHRDKSPNKVDCPNIINSTIPLQTVLLFFAATLTSAILLELLPYAKNRLFLTKDPDLSKNNTQYTLKYAIYLKGRSENHLNHIIDILDQFGYERTSLTGNWDLLWAHDYPYTNSQLKLRNLQAHRMVNHIPGCGLITNKVDLCTTDLPFLPPAFRLPSQSDEFLVYSAKHPNALFLEKHNQHRQIQIRSPDKINLTSLNSFVQEFVQNPLLIDGHKFDIGVYVVITSVDPLRVYIYGGDVLFRFCPIKYHPFDDKVVDKYVVGDDYLPIWDVPSLKKYYITFEGSSRDAFDAYLSDRGETTAAIWSKVEDIIRTTIQYKEKELERVTRLYGNWRHYFDLIRFDMIIDDKLNVHLMEANMSPNLSSAHFKPNALLYEQILYSVFNLVGIGSPFVRRHSLEIESSVVAHMITADKNIATNIGECAKNNCDKACNRDVCILCLPCLSGSQYEMLSRAHREHLHRTNMLRIIPRPILDLNDYDINAEVQNMTIRNKIMTRWFYNKCLYDRSWCC